MTLYCHFIKIIKVSGTSFQSPAFNQKHVRNVFVRYSSIWSNLILIKRMIQKIQANVQLPLYIDIYGDVTDFEIWDFTKTQKSRYLENETLFFLQIKKPH